MIKLIENQKLQNLADTLSRSGLVASASEAVRMAENILGTERRVAKNFDEKHGFIDKSLDRRSYQEEIDDLIQKTSPENKKYHIPIKGYTNARDPDENLSENPNNDVAEMREIHKEEDLMHNKIINSAHTKENPLQDVPRINVTAPRPSTEEAVLHNQESEQNILDDERNLLELMDEDAKAIYSNKQKEDTPEYTFVNVEQLEEAAKPNEDSSEPEQLFKEIKEEKSSNRDFKKPIDDVDLMDYFKFG